MDLEHGAEQRIPEHVLRVVLGATDLLQHDLDLDAALAIQNGVAYGLTGGIHTLDPARAAHWLAHVEVGNAYVNRGVTGAIVGRQPFGGWKRSGFGDLNQHGPSSIIFYTKVKTVTQRWPAGSHGAEFVIPTMK